MDSLISLLILTVLVMVSCIVCIFSVRTVWQCDNAVRTRTVSYGIIANAMSEAAYVEFDETILSGSKVIDAIVQHQDMLTITVKTENGTVFVLPDSEYPDRRSLHSIISNSRQYKCSIDVSDNGDVEGIDFEVI